MAKRTIKTNQIAVQQASGSSENLLELKDSAGATLYTINSSGAPSAGGIGGSTGATANAVLRADGTGGVTLKNSALIIADNGNMDLTTTTASGEYDFLNVNNVNGSNPRIHIASGEFRVRIGSLNTLTIDSAGKVFAPDSFIANLAAEYRSDRLHITGAGHILYDTIPDSATSAFTVGNPSGSLDHLSLFQITINKAGNRGMLIKGASGQTARYLEFRDSTDLPLTYFDANGQFIPQSGAISLGISSNPWLITYTQNVFGAPGGNVQVGTVGSGGTSGNMLVDTGGATLTGSSGTATFKSGNKGSGTAGSTGATVVQSGNISTNTTGDTGAVTVQSGNTTSTDAGSDSGVVLVTSGTSATGLTGDVSMRSGAALLANSSGVVRMISGSTVDGNSGGVQMTTGNATGAAAGSTGTIDLTTGNATFGNSGAINLTTGTDGAGGTRGQIRFQDGTQGTIGHVWTSTSVNGHGAWAAAGGGGANTALSNLAAVAINANLIPDGNGTRSIGSNGAQWSEFYLRTLRMYSQSGVAQGYLDGDTVTVPSGGTSHLTLYPASDNMAVSLFTQSTSSTTNSGIVYLNTGNNTASSGAAATGLIQIKTGNKTNAGSSGASGAVSITSGTTAGSGVTGGITVSSGNAAGAMSGALNLLTGTSSSLSGAIFLTTGAAPSRGGITLSGAQISVDGNITFANASAQLTVTDSGGSGNFDFIGNFTSPTGITNVGGIRSKPTTGNHIVVSTSNEPAADSVATKNVLIESGNKTAGTGASGNIKLQSGTSAGGASGNIVLTTGTAGTTRGEVQIDASETKITGGLTVGSSGNSIGTMLTGSGSITVPALLALTSADVGNITVTGLADGDFVYVTPPNAAFEDGMMYSCYVSATDTLTINVFNGSAGTFTGSTQNWRYFVVKAG